MGSIGNKVTAFMLGLGLLGGGVFAVDAAAAPVDAPTMSLAVAQATPDATPGVDDQQCREEENTDNGEQEANGAEDDIQDEHGADDAAEGDTEDNGDGEQDKNSENDAAEGDTEDNDDDEQSENGAEQESANATPGAVTEGQDLLPQAKITVEQAVTTAQGAATGELGTVELEDQTGTLVFDVTVGDQAVTVDAATGTVASVEPVRNTEHECKDDAAVAPGTLTEGQDLLPQAKITVEQAVTTAQGAAMSDLGAAVLDRTGEVLSAARANHSGLQTG